MTQKTSGRRGEGPLRRPWAGLGSGRPLVLRRGSSRQDERAHRVQRRHGAVEEVVVLLWRRHRVPKPHVAALLGPDRETQRPPLLMEPGTPHGKAPATTGTAGTTSPVTARLRFNSSPAGQSPAQKRVLPSNLPSKYRAALHTRPHSQRAGAPPCAPRPGPHPW